MERIVSPEERMRRAEEIYYRRRAQGVRVSTTSVNVGKKNKISLGKKMVIQIFACIIIYSAFWVVKGYNNVFSENFINQTKNILSYDINFINLYNNAMEYFNSNFNSIMEKEDLQSEENPEDLNEGDKDSVDSVDSENGDEISNEEENISNTEIGGGTDNFQNVNLDGTIKAEEDAKNLSQMQQDAEFVKQNFNITKPIEGYITSGFGSREQTEIISAFHQGIDIGANSGTPIYAAMEGNVVASSLAGDYGNHIKIQNGEIITVYAHCSELEVNVGDQIAQGQEIGKVGATGKATRTSSTL